ncbi:hypothetical protein IT414_03185 [bacterium]|nr:hypothetical protein [bacterium]
MHSWHFAASGRLAAVDELSAVGRPADGRTAVWVGPLQFCWLLTVPVIDLVAERADLLATGAGVWGLLVDRIQWVVGPPEDDLRQDEADP